MASGSFASGQQPQPPQTSHQPPQQQQQQQQPYAMDMDLGYPSAAAAAVAMGEAYRSQGNLFGELEYQAQVEENQQSQRRRRQAGSSEGNAAVQAAPPVSMGAADKQQQHMGQFGILAPTPVPVPHPHGSMAPVMGQQTLHFAPAMPTGVGAGAADDASSAMPAAQGKLGGKIVVDPPDLQAWREKLFNVDEMIVLTQEQFETYFPHVDNVYSHRSTQKYKRKPFISHYWDCRMKGRPPGTPKTEDPNKKRRRRSARERDLCDVKIKITEYFPSSEPLQLDTSDTSAATAAAVAAGYHGQRFWTIQRVNGNGGNGKGDGVAGPHKHTLAKSDEIKKNSVQRHAAAQDKVAKRAQPAPRRTSGAAAVTAKKHTRDGGDLRLYAASYCPFSQRVWIALEAKGVPYQYCETDPHRRPAQPALLEANPQGKINTDLLAAFYALLRNTDLARRPDLIARLQAQLGRLVQAADEHGPYFLGPMLSLVDVHLAPFALRLRTILHPRRGWPDPAGPAGGGGSSERWARWLDALERDPHVKATMSADDLYADTADLLINNPAPVPL
ncbi:Thioredoxin-like fold protein [Beauveria brongniartii RCEF 3172]|uniref:Thioredoxin-like fold protein n=1 Tax=Beauveria brongniartii RCEF 3172 TaxID=1081107 RepID=A0A162HTB2_9HYPO|nr:Thioredoxin-like fold protein [Beauveria brongniartii RCEF 3172]